MCAHVLLSINELIKLGVEKRYHFLIHNVRFYLSYYIYIISLKLLFGFNLPYIICGIVIARRYFITLPKSIFH